MSETQASPFKKPECGDMHILGKSVTIKDVLDGLVNFQVVGTDPGVVGPVIAPLSGDFAPTAGTLNPDGTFLIIPETDNGVYCVVLADGTEFTITAVQSHANLGQVMPMRIIKVLKQGTTGSFSVVY